MPSGIVGLQVQAQDAAGLVNGIVRAEQSGVAAAWLITGVTLPDGLTVLAAAAARTERILLGTAITPSYPRHPLVTAQQALSVHSLARGRFRLGVGPGGKGAIERAYGIPYSHPHQHLRAYMKVVKALLQEGAVDVEEAGIVAHARLPEPPPGVSVYASALRRRAFELCGEVADGAITWLCPTAHVRDVGLPALRTGAERAGRAVPPLVMHVPACVSKDRPAVREAVRRQFGFYVTLAAYAAVFIDAGFPEAREGKWSDRMIDALVVSGSEDEVRRQFESLLAMGVDELMVSPVGAGSDPPATLDRTLRLIGEMAPTPTGE